MARHNQYHDEHFREFITRLEPILAEHGDNTEALQRSQVNKLTRLEKKFRKVLVQHPRGSDTYLAFVNHILDVKRNILMARPYFRERDKTFKALISPVFKERAHDALKQFSINYQFIDFVLKQGGWDETKAGRDLLVIADEVKDIRQELAECNMPLAISQARMFLERNRRCHLRYMDMNQTCFVGLLEGIDKYVGPYHKRFRAVLIGRMLGNLIESNSETFVHFFPSDKRRIYRARKIIGQMGQDGPPEFDEICKRLNEMERKDNDDRETAREATQAIDGIVRKPKPDPMTTVGELVNLLAAAHVIPSSSLSLTSRDEEDGHTNAIEKYPAEDSFRPDVSVEEAEARYVVSGYVDTLPLIDRKLLRMKGIELGS